MIAILLFTLLRLHSLHSLTSLPDPLPLVTSYLLDTLKPKILALVTHSLVSGPVYRACLALFRLATRDQETCLALQLSRLSASQHQLTPQDLDISSYFLLNQASPIWDIFHRTNTTTTCGALGTAPREDCGEELSVVGDSMEEFASRLDNDLLNDSETLRVASTNSRSPEAGNEEV